MHCKKRLRVIGQTVVASVSFAQKNILATRTSADGVFGNVLANIIPLNFKKRPPLSTPP